MWFAQVFFYYAVVIPLFVAFCSMLLFLLLLFWINISPLVFCRCGSSYPNSSSLGLEDEIFFTKNLCLLMIFKLFMFFLKFFD
jgi:hypothetical protein